MPSFHAKYFQTVSLLLGATLVFSGVQHSWNPYAFLYAIHGYRLLSAGPAAALSIYLPALQIVVGVSLISGRCYSAARFLAAGLFALFTFAQLSAFLRGLNIDCGCFGAAYSHRVNWTSVSIVGGFLGLAVSLIIVRVRPNRVSVKGSEERTEGSQGTAE